MTALTTTRWTMPVSRVAFLGPMGIGKTTALRSVCGENMVGSDVPNRDGRSDTKEFTTVGTEFGHIDLGEGEFIQLCSCPGQERFDFLRQWVASTSMGVFVLADAKAPDAAISTSRLLAEIADIEHPPQCIVLSARPYELPVIQELSRDLNMAGHGIVPIIQVDVRNRSDVLRALSLMISMIVLGNESR